jgi:hypothetical protein
MWLRRTLYTVQFGAAIVLPLWLLVGRALFGGDVDGDLLALVVLAPLVALGLAALSGVTAARASVRRLRTLGWADVAVLAVVWAAFVVAGALPALSPLLVLAIALLFGAFWLQTWRLIAETRARVRSAFATLDRLRVPPATPPRRPEVIVIESGERRS